MAKKTTTKKKKPTSGDRARELVKLLTPVAKAVSLIEFRYSALSASVDPTLLKQKFDEPATGRPSHAAEWEWLDETVLGVQVHLRVELFTSADEDQSLANAEASYFLVFEVKGGGEYTDEQLDAFALVNGSHNAWPYWRQFVYSSLRDLGIIAPVIPTFRAHMVV